MDEEEFLAMLEALPPQERERVLYDMGYGEATETPWSFGESSAPELDYGNYDLLQMGGGVDLPEFTSKGAVDPFDLTQQGKRVNLAQDYGALILDNILSAMSGPGAYDIGAFTPSYDYGEPLNLTGRRKAEARAQQGGYEGFLADLILNENMSPSEAEAVMWGIVETPDDDPDLTEEDRERKKSLLATLPKRQVTGPEATMMASGIQGDLTGVAGAKSAAGAARNQYDLEKISSAGETLWTELMEDPEFAYEENGKYYGRTPEEAMIKTPQMEFFDKYGLPYPTANYTDPKYLESELNAQQGTTPDERAMMQQAFEQEMAGMNQQVEGASGRYKAANEANRALGKAWQEAPRRPQTEFDAILKAFQEGTDQTAAQEAYRAGPQQPVTAGQAGAAITNQLRGTGQDVGPVTMPQFSEMLRQQFQDLGGSSAIPQRPMVREASWVTNDQYGNLLPYDAENLPELGRSEPLGRVSDLFRGRRAPQRTMRRLDEADLAAQEQRRQDASRQVQQTSAARQRATYRDPRLAAIQQGAYLDALMRQGRTPFNDAIAIRRQGNRAIGV